METPIAVGEEYSTGRQKLLGYSVRLRPTDRSDLPLLFEFQLDKDSNDLAATHPRSIEDFNKFFDGIFADPDVIERTIVIAADNGSDDEHDDIKNEKEPVVVGRISCFKAGSDKYSVGYWIDKKFWGRGIATRALHVLLDSVAHRPLHASVASQNIGSLRVLEKCGFVVVGREHAPADERYQECEEVLLELAK